ncbi:MAG TPA: hypothetical protein VG894_12705, partial [Bauldia sp.]|nr:hypothetical protein [Bauldia sp.]
MLRYALLAGALALAFSVPALAAGKKQKPVPAAKTVTVPLPHLSPRTPAAAATDPPAAGNGSTDAIGALIASGGDEENATEDSDKPEAAPAAPDLDLGLPPMPPPRTASPANATGLQLAVKLLDNNDPGGAMAAAYALPDKLDLKLVDWLIATGGYAGVPSSSIASLQKQVAGWPGQSLIRLRFEQALKREQPGSAAVIAALGGTTPVSDDGKIMLAAAYLDQGRSGDAAAIIQPLWRDGDFPQATETTIATKFGSLLRAADHKARMDRLLYAENSAAGLRAAQHLDKNQQALAKAVVLQIKNSSKAVAALDALPAALKRDPLWLYSKVDALRTAGKLEDAGRLIQSAPHDAKALEAPDTWWVERRLLSRALVSAGDAKLAYQVAAGHAAESPGMKAEAEFHAGWYALEYLHDPVTATGHFANIAAISTLPLSLSRAEYWLGRAAEAAGNLASATTHYQRAAGYPTTFYGQLAISKLGGKALRLPPPPTPTSADRQNFEARDLVKVIRHLDAVGYDDRTPIFFRTLAEQITSPGEIALLTALADGDGNHQLALQLAKTAVSRGVPVDALAFPT